MGLFMWETEEERIAKNVKESQKRDREYQLYRLRQREVEALERLAGIPNGYDP